MPRRVHEPQPAVDAVEKQAHVLDDIGAAPLGWGRAQRGKPLFYIGLRLGDVPARRADALDGKALLLSVRQAQQRPRVALGQGVFLRGGAHRLRQAQQAQLVGDGGLGLAELLRSLLLREVIAADERARASASSSSRGRGAGDFR